MARPTKCTPETKAVILKALRAGNTRTAAVEAAGITLEALRLWLKKDLEFLGDIKAAEAAAELDAVKTIRKSFTTHWQSAAWWLERRRPDEWGKVDRVEITFRQQAERIAQELGCTVEEVIDAAEAIANAR